MINFPNYTQFDQKDCGPVCLKIIAKYYGKDYSIQFLRENSFLTREGVSMLGIADAAKTIGLESTGVSMNFNELKSLINRPCILHWNQEHFVVCYRIKANKKRSIIYISDPVGEKYKLDEKSFLKCWLGDGNKGYALLIEPTTLFYKREVPNKIKSKAFEKILHNLKNYKKKGMLLILALIIGGLFSFILPFLT